MPTPGSQDNPLSATSTGNTQTDRGGKTNTSSRIEHHHHPAALPEWPTQAGRIPAPAAARLTSSHTLSRGVERLAVQQPTSRRETC
jgi:hypothetical protein